MSRALAADRDHKGALGVVRDLERSRGEKGLFAYELGVIHATLGDVEEAFEWLTRAVQERSG